MNCMSKSRDSIILIHTLFAIKKDKNKHFLTHFEGSRGGDLYASENADNYECP